MILLPSVAVAIPCCNPLLEAECCGPGGDCPPGPSGDCALSAGSAPLVAVTPLSLDAPGVVRAPVGWIAAPPRNAAAPVLPARQAPPIPLYLGLGSLRN